MTVEVVESRCETGLGSRVLQGGLWGVGGQGVTIAASFVATPFVIRELGSDAYGVLNLINLAVGSFAFADLGMGSASTRFAADFYARGDGEGESQVVWSALALMAGPTAIAALLLFLGAPAFAADFLRLPPHLSGPATAAFRIAALGLVARNVAAVLNTPQMVRMRLGLVTLINSGCGVAQVVVVPMVLSRGGGLAGAAAVISGAALATAALHGAIGLRLNRHLLSPRLNPLLVRPLAGFGGALAVSALTQIGLSHGEKLLLGRYGSVAALAHYSVASTLAGLLGLAPGAITQALLPAFSGLQATADRGRLRRLYSESIGWVFLLTVPGATGLCIAAKPFFTLWAGPEFGQASTGPLYVLVLGLLVNVVAYVPYTLLTALGRTRQVARFHLLELIPYLVWAALLTYSFGAIGAAAAWTTRVLFGAAWLLITLRRLLGPGEAAEAIPFGRFLGASAAPLAGVLAVIAFDPGIGVRGGMAAVTLSLYGAIVWTRVLRDDQRRQLRFTAGRFVPFRLSTESSI